jgi:putative MFS transporter
MTLINVAGRLERLPLSKFHRRFITLISLGAWFDFYDIFMVAYLGASLHASGFFNLRQLSLFISAGFIGMFVGTIVFGIGSDYLGRRSAFIFMLLIYSFFTLLGAFSPSPRWLIASRVLAGLGIGAEIVVIDTYVTEMVPSTVRGRYVAITQVSGFTAVPVVAALSWLLVPTHFLLEGWRWVMVIGAMGALLAWYLRRSLTESPRWLESRGREFEAEQIIRRIEAEVQMEMGRPLTRVSDIPAEFSKQFPLAELWRGPYLRRTLMLIGFHFLQTIGIYGYANWLPTFLVQQGIPLVRSLGYTLLMALASPLGPLIAVWTADRIERKWTITALSAVIAIAGLGFAQARSPVSIVFFGALITLLSYWFSAALHAYQAELFPTRARATGVGFTYSWSRLSAALSSLVIGALLVHGVAAVILFVSLSWLGVALIIGLLGPRTNAIPLEVVSR